MDFDADNIELEAADNSKCMKKITSFFIVNYILHLLLINYMLNKM